MNRNLETKPFKSPSLKPALLATAITLAGVPSVVLANSIGDGGEHHMGWGGGTMIWAYGPLMMIGIVALIVFVVVSIMRGSTSGQRGRAEGNRTPKEILEERYARGEIDHDEFDQRRKNLE